MRTDKNTFRDFNSIIMDISNSWSSYNDVQKAEIATAIGGTYQRNRFLVLMQNMNVALKLQTVEANSAGNAMTRYGVYAKSTEAKMNDLTNTLQKMWMSLIKSDTINSFITGMTSVVKVIGQIASSPITAFVASLVAAGVAAKVLGVALNAIKLSEFAIGIYNVVTNIGMATGAMAKLAEFGAIFNPWILAAVAVTAVIYGTVKATEAMTWTLSDQGKAVDKLASSTSALNTQIKQLQSSSTPSSESQKTITLLEAQYKIEQDQLKVEKEKWAQMKLNSLTTISTESGSMGKVNVNTGKSTELDDYNKQLQDSLDLQNKIQDIQAKGSEGKGTLADTANLAKYNDQLVNNKSNLMKIYTSLLPLQKTLGKDLPSSVANLINQLGGFLKVNGDITTSIKSIEATATSAFGNIWDSDKTLYSNIVKDTDTLPALLYTAYGKDSKNFKTIADMKQATNAFLITALGKDWANFYGSQEEALQALIGGVSTVASTGVIPVTKGLSKTGSLPALKGSFSVGLPALKEVLPTKSVKTTKYATAAKAMSDALIKMENGLDKAANDALNSANNPSSYTPPGADGSGSSGAAAKTASVKDLEQAIIDTINQQSILDSKQNDSLSAQISAADSAKDYTKEIELQNQLLANQNKTVTDLQTANAKIHAEANSVRKTTSYNTATWFNADGTDSVAYLKLYNSASADTQTKLQGIHDKLVADATAWKSNKTAIDTVKTSITSTTSAIKNLILEQEKAVEQTKLDAATQKQADYQSALAAVNTLIEEQITKLNAQKDAINAANTATEDALTLEKDQAALNSAETEKNVRIYSVKTGWTWSTNQDAIDTANENLRQFNVQQQLAAIDAQIKGLDDYKSAWADTVNEYQNSQDTLHANELLTNDWESKIFDDRLTTLKTFADNYTAEQKKIADSTASIASITTQESGTTSNVTSSGTATSGTKVGDTVITGTGTGGAIHAYTVVGTGDTTKTTNGVYNPKSNLTSVQKYDGGGDWESGTMGVNLTGEKEHVLTPEQTKVWNQMPNLLSGLISMGRSNVASNSNMSTSNDRSSHLSIASMNVTSNNAGDFVKQMRNLVAITGNTPG
jgi:hypothetical protein